MTPLAQHTGRYAPSPTGDLHLGNLRTALAAWLHARATGGRFLLRLDDLDTERVRADVEQRQLADLAAVGIDWDGPVVRQSERLDRYELALDRLRGAGLVYPCFCSRAEVRAAASAPHGPGDEGTYPGTCARLSPADVAARVAAGEPHCLRVRAGGVLRSFEDEALGPISASVDDFVVQRRDGVPAYNLATVVDDHELGVTEVVRGADLASTTPRHLWLADALGFDGPRHLHVPLVLGPDGSRLAKRHGSVTLADLAALGYDADSVRRMLATSLGFPLDVDMTPTSLIDAFPRVKMPTGDLELRVVDGRPTLEQHERRQPL